MSVKDQHLDDFSEIHLIPYMHTDYAWTNSRNWHIWRYIYGYKRALLLMREDPEFTYVLDNLHHSFSAFRKYCPELFEEFRTRVKEGRFVIANGGYALARPNYSGDEAYVRNIVEGRRGFSSLLDIPETESRFFFNADTAIGHSQLPQILSLTGNRYYRANRPAATMNRKGIPRQFVWKGLDGSEVIVARGEYGGLFVTDRLDRSRDLDRDWEEISAEYWGIEKENASNSDSDKLMLFFGCDDVIPGCNLIDRPVPYREFIAVWNRRRKSKMMLSTPGRYFARLEEERASLPVVNGVLDHCDLSYNIPYKGRDSMWYRRRMLERQILRLEYLRSMLCDLGERREDGDLKELWLALFCISGHAMEFLLTEDYKKAAEAGDEALLRAGRLIAETEERISDLIVNRGDADRRITEYTVINPIPEAREEIVKLHVTTPHGLNSLSLTDTEGRELPFQITEVYIADKAYECECNAADLLTSVKLPPSGYITVTAGPGREGSLRLPDEQIRAGASLSSDGEEETVVVDTGKLLAAFRKGELVSLERNGKRSIGSFGKPRFSEFRQKSAGWATIWGDADEFEFRPKEWGLVQRGPLRWVYRVKGELRTADVQLDIILNYGSARIDYAITLDCARNEGIFTVSFPCDPDTELYADIPYGVEHRDLSEEPSAERQGNIGNPDDYFYWESAWRGQFFARNFALFRKDGWNTALISDTCGIYYSLRRDFGTVSLLLQGQLDLNEKSDRRGDNWVKMISPSFTGVGKNEYRFSLCLFEESDREELFCSAARETALLHFKPSAVAQFGFPSSGVLPPCASVLSHDGGNAVIKACYEENGERVIRGYEASGQAGRIRLKTAGWFTQAYKADLLGNPIGAPLEMNDGETVFPVGKWEIFTIRMKP